MKTNEKMLVAMVFDKPIIYCDRNFIFEAQTPEATKLELNVLDRRKYSMLPALELLVLNIKDRLKRILPISWYLKIRSQHQQTRAARRKDGNATILHNYQPEL